MKKLYARARRRLLLLVHRLVPYRLSLRPRRVLERAAQLAVPAGHYTDLGAYHSKLHVRPDLFTLVSPYFAYDVKNHDGPEPSFEARYDYGVAQLPQGRLWTDNALSIAVVSQDGQLVADLSYQYDRERPADGASNEAMRMLWWPEVEEVQGTVLSLLAGGGATNNYGHWLIDTLPRLHFVKQAGLLDAIDTFLVPSMRFDFQQDSLMMLGIPPEKVRAAAPGMHIRSERLIATTHPRGNRTYVMPDWVVDWNRAHFLERCLAKTAGESFASRIYITRRDTSIRKVVNEDEVIAALEPLGFKAYTMAELAFARKIGLFARAEMVISVSGAGLNNLMFAPPGAQLLEIFPPGLVHTQYYGLARYNAMVYDYMICQAAEKGTASNMDEGRSGHVQLDIAELLERVGRLVVA